MDAGKPEPERVRPAPERAALGGARAVAPELVEALRRHRDGFEPRYPPKQNSDHGPMVLLALHGLGAAPAEIAQFLDGYRKRLQPLAGLGEPLSRLEPGLGQPGAYGPLVGFFDGEISRLGLQGAVRLHLPRLAPAWPFDAFHPFIRLAYGVEFGVASEVAAGLAYLACHAGGEGLAEHAGAAPSDACGADYFRELQPLRDPRWSSGRFNDRCAAIVAGARLRPPRPDPLALEALSSACLEAFHATHDFFALHLVTASHAAAVCEALAGPSFSGICGVGLAVGYLAIGAPELAGIAPERVPPDVPPLAPRPGMDEHDIKLAFACESQLALRGDLRYRWVAARYLEARLGSAG